MAAKAILSLCASALFIQMGSCALLGGLAGPYGYAGAGCGCNGLAGSALAYDGYPGAAWGYEGLGYGCGSVASTGGGLPCASASPIPPVGVSVLSENAYEGVLAAGGNLPFLGTVGIEGVLPTAGAGAVSYGCGNSCCAIGAEEGAIATGIAPHAPTPYGSYGAFGAYGPTGAYKGLSAGFGYGAGLGYGAGCGYGAIY